MTRVRCRNKRDCWDHHKRAMHKYMPYINFLMTGMSFYCFQCIWHAIRYSRQPAVRPTDMATSTYPWLLVDNFVNIFINHRVRNFSPSDSICVDESISRWYGMSGHWIDEGLPMYVAINHKPENGCKIQDCCDARARVML